MKKKMFVVRILVHMKSSFRMAKCFIDSNREFVKISSETFARAETY